MTKAETFIMNATLILAVACVALGFSILTFAVTITLIS